MEEDTAEVIALAIGLLALFVGAYWGTKRGSAGYPLSLLMGCMGVVGLVGVGFCFLALMAEGMSDNPGYRSHTPMQSLLWGGASLAMTGLSVGMLLGRLRAMFFQPPRDRNQ